MCCCFTLKFVLTQSLQHLNLYWYALSLLIKNFLSGLKQSCEVISFFICLFHCHIRCSVFFSCTHVDSHFTLSFIIISVFSVVFCVLGRCLACKKAVIAFAKPLLMFCLGDLLLIQKPRSKQPCCFSLARDSLSIAVVLLKVS